MKKTARNGRLRFGLALAITLSAVIALLGSAAPPVAGQSPSDDVLKERVERALMNASDLPAANIGVEVSGGVVTLAVTASSLCEGHDCPALTTAGGLGAVQQAIGAVVRAVPGVRAVQFSRGFEREGGRTIS